MASLDAALGKIVADDRESMPLYPSLRFALRINGSGEVNLPYWLLK